MKIEDARKMKKGSAVQWNLGNGWYQKGEFLGLHMVTRFKSMTFNDLFTGNFDFSKGGKQELMASVKYLDDKGRERYESISIRRLQPKEDGHIWINGKTR